MKPLIFAIDFDGTLAEHSGNFPTIGAEVPGAVESLAALQAAGHRLILWTVRDGSHLFDALIWCRDRKIVFWGVNENPTQVRWSSSPKAHAHAYIDDLAAGVPLVHPDGRRSYVDWPAVMSVLEQGVLGDVPPLRITIGPSE